MIDKKKKIEDYIEYDETSSSCLRYKKSIRKTWGVGMECFKCLSNPNNRHTPYYSGTFDGKTYYGHQIVWYLHHKEWSNHNKVINHIDGNGLNNRVDNLELVSPSRNSSHKNKLLNSNSVTGVRGISSCPHYPSTNVVNYKQIYRGRKPTLEEGIELWNKCYEYDLQGIVYRELKYNVK